MAVGAVTAAAVNRVEAMPPRREALAPVSAAVLGERVSDRDKVRISEEAKERRMVEEELQRQQRRREERKALLEAALDPGKPVLPTESMGRCATIAGRLMRGDSVPAEDEEYLSANAPELYQQASLMRQTGGEAEDQGSVLTQEDVVHGEAAMAMKVLRPELRKLGKLLLECAEEPQYEDMA